MAKKTVQSFMSKLKSASAAASPKVGSLDQAMEAPGAFGKKAPKAAPKPIRSIDEMRKKLKSKGIY